MRDLVVTENITVDGVIDASGGWFFPAADDEPADQSDVTEELARQRGAADAFLTGRVTFEEMRGFWPHVEDDTSGNTDYLNRVDTYVVSRSMTDPEWDNSTVLSGLGDVADLKAQEAGDIVVTGSIQLVHALVEAALVDEYRLFVYPTVMGSGARLFQGAEIASLHLQEARPFRSGVTLLRYRTD